MEYKLLTPKISVPNSASVLEKIFSARGITPSEIYHYLNTTDEDIYSSKLIDRIDEGCKMLASHIAQNHKIFIQVDSDCDGYTSAAALINYLNCLFPYFAQNNIDYRIHTGKQHGLLDEVVEDIINNDYHLVIAPDSSSNNFEQHKKLKENGIDVLVIDHHEAEKISENACIINNQLCDYPNKTLSGVGMVYKFCCHFDSIMHTYYADDILDLVAIGLIADMMDIRNFETKRLIELGLGHIRNPFLKEMIKAQNYSIERAGGLCPFAISFYISPQVNGTIRMGNQEEKKLLFESMLDFKGYAQIPSTKRGCKGQTETVAEQACRNCTNIKRNQAKAIEDSLEVVENIIASKNLEANKIIAVKLDKVSNRNLTGLIANQLMAKYQHPFMLLTKVVDENGNVSWEGSGRGFESADFNDLRAFVQKSGFATFAEGHANAFGVGFADEDFEDFIFYSNTALRKINFTPCTKVDFIWQANNVKTNDVVEIANLKTIWGQELSEPVVAVEHIYINRENTTLLGRTGKCPTLKIRLPSGVDLIKFKVDEEEYESLFCDNSSKQKVIHIVGVCKTNEWNGSITPQIEIKDYEIMGERFNF